MTPKRKDEVVLLLKELAETFRQTEEVPEMSMFWLVSKYNSQYENRELIGGAWVRENVPEFSALP